MAKSKKNTTDTNKVEAITDYQVPQLEYIALTDIEANPLNPRKEFEESALNELAASITSIGVIEAVTLRPNPRFGKVKAAKKYELICGERRFRASILAGLKTIPASIRQLNDQEAMEIMITENLQRKDVHPAEEANSFTYMLDSMGYTRVDIAAKIGKPEHYVNRRLQLLSLIPEITTIFKTNELPIGHAELLSRLDADDQSFWFKNKYSHQWQGGIGTLKELKNWITQNTQNSLTDAPFDINEVGLGDIKSNACTGCPFNSAIMATLFPDVAETATCTYRACFRNKCEKNLMREVEKALVDPNIILVNDNYSFTSFAEQLNADGKKVLKKHDDFQTVSEPSLDEWIENVDADDFETDEEFQEAIEEAKKNYDEELQDFQADNLKRALDVVSGHYIYIKLNEKSKTATQVADPDYQQQQMITDLEQKRKRGLELDKEKVMKKVVDRMKTLPIVTGETTAPISNEEMNCLLAIAYTHTGYGSNQKKMHEMLGLPDGYGSYNHGPQLIDAIANASPEARAYIIRAAIINHFTGIYPAGISGGITFEVAKDWCPNELKQFEDEQDVAKVKRETRLNERIAEIQKSQVSANHENQAA